jgi:hypothetical protein
VSLENLRSCGRVRKSQEIIPAIGVLCLIFAHTTTRNVDIIVYDVGRVDYDVVVLRAVSHLQIAHTPAIQAHNR